MTASSAHGRLTPYERAAAPYRPTHLRVLFVAESPPAVVDRYFYYPDVRTQDSLWVQLMRALYPDFGATAAERPRKAEWLARFAQHGFQLIDAVKEPFPGSASPSRRTQVIRAGAAALIEEIRDLAPDQVVLIKSTVFDALSGELRAHGLPVVNRRALPFPGSGQQRRFQEEFRSLVDHGRLTI